MDPVILSIYCWILVAYKWTCAVQTYCSSVDCIFFFILNHIGNSTHNIFRSDQNEGNSYCWWGRGFSDQDLEMLLPSGLSLINYFYFLLLLQRTTFFYSFHSAKWSLFFSGVATLEIVMDIKGHSCFGAGTTFADVLSSEWCYQGNDLKFLFLIKSRRNSVVFAQFYYLG